METHSKHLSAEERRAVTVETVVALAAEGNPGEITLAAIARRMGVTQGALFRHFPDKGAIWQAVLDWVAERLLNRVERAALGASGPLAALKAMFDSHIEFVAEHPGVPRMIIGELQRSGETPAKAMVRNLLRRYGERLRRVIEDGRAAGEIAPEVDAGAAAALFIGAIQGLVMQALIRGDMDQLKPEAAQAFALYRRAIAGGAS